MRKILIIEDNRDVRENITEILELAGYQVISATDGKSGVELALNNFPDLVICDIMMPALDGYSVLSKLNNNKETAGIPFIFLSAKSEKTDLRKGMSLGADDYLTKPFDRMDLLNAVEIRLKKYEAIKNVAAGASATIDEFINAARQNADIKLISSDREVYSFKKKHVIYVEGQKPKAVYYILQGKIKVYKTNQEGKELITNIYTAGDFFGYNVVLENINHTDNSQVLEDAEVMFISTEDFASLLIHDTQIARQFIKLISKNILEKEQMLLSMAYNSLRKKVAYGIMQLNDKYGKDVQHNGVLEISRENLAQLVGVATESLIRTLADFKAENLVELQAGKIIILQEKKLRDMPN